MALLINTINQDMTSPLIKDAYRRNILFKKSLVCCLVLFSFNSYSAGVAESATVIDVRIDISGLGFIRFDKPLVGAPAACTNEGHTSHLSFDVNTAPGKAIMSLALAAQASGKRVWAKGTGSCDGYNVVERWRYGWIQN